MAYFKATFKYSLLIKYAERHDKKNLINVKFRQFKLSLLLKGII